MMRRRGTRDAPSSSGSRARHRLPSLVHSVFGALLLVLALVPAGAAAQDPADEAWEAGNLDRARELYAQRLAADSTDAQALYRMALLRGWNQEYAESIALFDRLIDLTPANLEARISRARVFAWRDDLGRATRDLNELVQEHPEYVPAIEALATFRSWAGEYDRAMELFDRIEQLDPDNRTVRYQRARVLGWANRFDRARAVYDSLLAQDPGDFQALLGLAQILSWEDRLDSARAVYHTILDEDADNLDAMTGLARTTGYAGDLIAAEARWREILERSPENLDALFGLVRILQWQGREAAALPYLEQALRVDPNSSEARDLLRSGHADLGPRVGWNLAYEWDSDGNNMYTTAVHTAWHPLPRVEVRVDGYRRAATLGAAIPDPRWTTGTTVSGSVQLPPGWRISGSVGGGVPDVAGVDGTLKYGLVASSPTRYQLRSTLSVSRELLDATAILLANRVVYDQVQLTLGTQLGRWRMEGAGSAAWFQSLMTGNGNRRIAVNAAASRPVTPWLDLGGSVRYFGFDADLNEGYFDPDLFLLVEAPASVSTRVLDHLEATLALVPGVQQINAAGEVNPAFRTSGSLSWQVRPGRWAALSLAYAANGASPFAEQAADYRYFSLNLRGRWVF